VIIALAHPIRMLSPLPDKRGGFNGSTQHQIEAQAQGFQQPGVVRERRLNGTPSWLGFDGMQPTDRFSRGQVMPDQLIRRCCIDRLNWQPLPDK
jgi:hypothetical protein